MSATSCSSGSPAGRRPRIRGRALAWRWWPSRPGCTAGRLRWKTARWAARGWCCAFPVPASARYRPSLAAPNLDLLGEIPPFWPNNSAFGCPSLPRALAPRGEKGPRGRFLVLEPHLGDGRVVRRIVGGVVKPGVRAALHQPSRRSPAIRGGAGGAEAVGRIRQHGHVRSRRLLGCRSLLRRSRPGGRNLLRRPRPGGWSLLRRPRPGGWSLLRRPRRWGWNILRRNQPGCWTFLRRHPLRRRSLPRRHLSRGRNLPRRHLFRGRGPPSPQPLEERNLGRRRIFRGRLVHRRRLVGNRDLRRRRLVFDGNHG